MTERNAFRAPFHCRWLWKGERWTPEIKAPGKDPVIPVQSESLHCGASLSEGPTERPPFNQQSSILMQAVLRKIRRSHCFRNKKWISDRASPVGEWYSLNGNNFITTTQPWQEGSSGKERKPSSYCDSRTIPSRLLHNVAVIEWVIKWDSVLVHYMYTKRAFTAQFVRGQSAAQQLPQLGTKTLPNWKLYELLSFLH